MAGRQWNRKPYQFSQFNSVQLFTQEGWGEGGEGECEEKIRLSMYVCVGKSRPTELCLEWLVELIDWAKRIVIEVLKAS